MNWTIPQKAQIIFFIALLLQTGCKITNNAVVKTSNTKVNLSGSDYGLIKPGRVQIHRFVNSKDTLVERTDSVQTEINGKKYFRMNKTYSWGVSQESFWRMEEHVVYAFNYKANVESVIIPKVIREGVTWLEGDKSWSYRIISTDASLKTPIATYSGLLKIEATQLTGRDKQKASRYHLFYKSGTGSIANVIHGKLYSYLKE